jgi:hypothetical protein
VAKADTMRIVIEQSEFRGLSPDTQQELIQKLTGSAIQLGKRSRSRGALSWRKPVDLSEDMAARLLHGLSEPHRLRLQLFANAGGRVRQRDLLAVTGDTDFRTLSHFQAVLSRRLRRFMEDPEGRAHVIGWDFEAEEWDGSHKTLLDGIYYVTDQTTKSLQSCFGQSNGGAD